MNTRSFLKSLIGLAVSPFAAKAIPAAKPIEPIVTTLTANVNTYCLLDGDWMHLPEMTDEEIQNLQIACITKPANDARRS